MTDSNPVTLKPRILVVDDEAPAQQAAVQILKEKYTVLCAANAAAALTSARRDHPALIILDVDLGRENGVLLCFQLRSDPVTADIPVLMLTGFGDTQMKQLAFQAGADDYIEKPVTPEELQDRVESKLRRWRDLRRNTA